jgi:hypothetical protein
MVSDLTPSCNNPFSLPRKNKLGSRVERAISLFVQERLFVPIENRCLHVPVSKNQKSEIKNQAVTRSSLDPLENHASQIFDLVLAPATSSLHLWKDFLAHRISRSEEVP